MASELVLVIEGGDRDGERFPLRSNRLTVGRAPGSDLLLKDGSVSSKHALLKLEGLTLEVEDLGSTNGTFFEGERVESVRVELGQSFQVGKIRMRLDRAGDAGKTGVGIPAPGQAASTAPAGTSGSATSGRAAVPAARAGERVAAPRATAEEEPAVSSRSEELKALFIGLAGAALVVGLGFYVLRRESPAARQLVESEAGPVETGVSLGGDAGFELEERDPAVAWETLPGSSGEASRANAGAAEGQRCLKIALQPALGERYVPSVGVALAENRLPSLAAGEVLDFEVLARADAEAGGALAARFHVDDDPSGPASVMRGALLSEAAAVEGAPGWKALRVRVAHGEEGAGDARYDLGLLGWSARGGAVYFDAARVESARPGSAAPSGSVAQPEVVELDADGRFRFAWSGLGSALIGRFSHRGEPRRLAVLRDLVFVPLESARPLWMDPNFAPLLAAGKAGTRRIPASYLRDRSAPIDLSWSWEEMPRGARRAIALTLSRSGAGGLPPVSFTLPNVLLAGNEDEAAARFGGDELVANWILDEDAAARRGGDPYPALSSSDEVLDGVVGLGFGSFELRSSLRLDRPVRAETRRVRGGVSVSLWAELQAGESLKVVLGPVDAPSDLEVETAKRTAQGHVAGNRIGAAVAALRGVLDRAVLVPHAASKRSRPNVDVVVRGQYAPLVQQLAQSMASAVQRFDAVRRRGEQALAVGSPDELRALLAQIEEAQGLAEIYRSTSYGPEIDRLRARLRAGLEAAIGADPRVEALQKLAEDLDHRRATSGASGPSPLAEYLRSRAR